MRARSEQTQLEDLSDASLLGKLLVLPANVRLDRKVLDRCKHSSLFGLVVSNEEKKFYNVDSRSEPHTRLTMDKSQKCKKIMFPQTNFIKLLVAVNYNLE